MTICTLALTLTMLTACGAGGTAPIATGEVETAEIPAADRECIYQVSLLQGLTLGDYYGSVSVSDLKANGDTGIGNSRA